MLTAPTTIRIAPLRTKNPKNSRQHWQAVWARTKRQRYATYLALREHLGATFAAGQPLEVLLTRIAPRLMDAEDNLPVTLSGCRDGVADYITNAGFEQGEDRLPWVRWRYAQRQGDVREYAVEVTLIPREEPPP